MTVTVTASQRVVSSTLPGGECLIALSRTVMRIRWRLVSGIMTAMSGGVGVATISTPRSSAIMRMAEAADCTAPSTETASPSSLGVTSRELRRSLTTY